MAQRGPVTRDRTFYFANYEGRRARANNIVVSPAAPQATVPNNEDEHLAFFKLDHRFSPNDIISMRYTGQWFKWLNENGVLWMPGSGITCRNNAQTALLTATQLVRAHNESLPYGRGAYYFGGPPS